MGIGCDCPPGRALSVVSGSNCPILCFTEPPTWLLVKRNVFLQNELLDRICSAVVEYRRSFYHQCLILICDSCSPWAKDYWK